MRALIALSILLVPYADAGSFAAPAQWDGEARGEVDGWLLALLPMNGTDQFEVSTGGGWMRFHERLQSTTYAGPVGQLYDIDRSMGPTAWQTMDQWTGRPASPVAFMARLLHADLEFAGNATIYPIGMDQPIPLPPEILRLSTLQQAVSEESVAVVITGAAQVSFTARNTEWWALDCSSCGDPDEKLVGIGGHQSGVQRTIEFDAPLSSTVNATGTFVLISPQSSWTVDGVLRLPLWNGTESRTLVGTTHLHQLMQADEGGLSADVSGEWRQVFADELPDASWTVTTMAVAAAAAGAAAILIGLIAKEILEEPLTQRKRRRLYGLIQEKPGLHFRELQRETGFGNGTLDYALTVLAKARLVTSNTESGRRHFYAVASPKHDPQDRLLAKIPSSYLEVVARRASHSPALRTDLVHLLEQGGASRATAYRTVKKMEAAGVLTGEDRLSLARWPAVLAQEMGLVTARKPSPGAAGADAAPS